MTRLTLDELKNYESVKLWLTSLSRGSDKEDEFTQHIIFLAEFCEYSGQDPDQLVEGCLRETKQGDLTISTKARKEIDKKIDDFVCSKGYSGYFGVLVGNYIRSFLIYNGVFMQGRVALW